MPLAKLLLIDLLEYERDRLAVETQVVKDRLKFRRYFDRRRLAVHDAEHGQHGGPQQVVIDRAHLVGLIITPAVAAKPHAIGKHGLRRRKVQLAVFLDDALALPGVLKCNPVGVVDTIKWMFIA